MRFVRTFVIALTAATVMSLGSGAGTAAAAQCSTESDGQRWCNASSTAYPNTIGWYGYVGHGGGPCGGGNPRGTTFEPGIGGICVMPPAVEVWKWTRAGWSRAHLADGTRTYVYPYTADWRWIYTGGSWYAIRASSLTLEWRA